MVCITAFVAYGSRKRRGSTWSIYGPTILTTFSGYFVMMDLIRHVLQDTNVWPAPGSSEYRSGCNTESMGCLSPVGWLFTFFFTYFGFALLLIGTMWNAKIAHQLRKIRAKWRELRNQNHVQDA